MRSSESYSTHHAESEERYRIQAKNAAKAKILAEAAAYTTPSLDDFRAPKALRDPYTINADERYVKTTEANFFSNGLKLSYHAKAFEHIFQFNVAQGRWLNGDNRYRTEVIPLTKYDDICNRIDVAITVHPQASTTIATSTKHTPLASTSLAKLILT